MNTPRVRIALMCAGLAACTSESRPPVLRLGTTYTVEQSGALALLDSLAPPLVPSVIVGPSGQILRSAAAGDLDVVITHAPSLEERLLVIPGRAVLRCPFVASRFVIVGPPEDRAHVAAASNAADAFRRIARSGAEFVSRGDSSGTHVKELSIWKSAGINPDASWHVDAGVDQAATLRIAEERDAYALADLPTFGRLAGIHLRALFSADSALGNPYTLYVVRSGRAESTATAFARWVMTDWRRRLLATKSFGAVAGECAAP